MPNPIPPIVLVKTWLSLAYYANDEESKRYAEEMLIDTFGSVEVAIIYAEENGISMSAN